MTFIKKVSTTSTLDAGSDSLKIQNTGNPITITSGTTLNLFGAGNTSPTYPDGEGSVNIVGSTDNGKIYILGGEESSGDGSIIINSQKTSAPIYVKSKNQSTGSSGPIELTTGNTDTIPAGTGYIYLFSGAGIGSTGPINLLTGVSTGSIPAPTGSLSIQSGSASGLASTGGITLATGSSSGTGVSGTISIGSGSTNSVASGSISITTGGSTSANTGSITIQTGTSSSGSGSGGTLALIGGNSPDSPGNITITGGNSTSNTDGSTSGSVTIKGGTVSNTTTGYGGSIYLETQLGAGGSSARGSSIEAYAKDNKSYMLFRTGTNTEDRIVFANGRDPGTGTNRTTITLTGGSHSAEIFAGQRSSTGTASSLYVSAGTANPAGTNVTGGDLILTAGSGIGTGNGGSVTVQAGDGALDGYVYVKTNGTNAAVFGPATNFATATTGQALVKGSSGQLEFSTISGGGSAVGIAVADAFGSTQLQYNNDISVSNGQQAGLYKSGADCTVVGAYLYSKAYGGGNQAIYFAVYDYLTGNIVSGATWPTANFSTTGWSHIPCTPFNLQKGKEYWLFGHAPGHDLGKKVNVGGRGWSTSFGALNQTPIALSADIGSAIIVYLEFS